MNWIEGGETFINVLKNEILCPRARFLEENLLHKTMYRSFISVKNLKSNWQNLTCWKVCRKGNLVVTNNFSTWNLAIFTLLSINWYLPVKALRVPQLSKWVVKLLRAGKGRTLLNRVCSLPFSGFYMQYICWSSFSLSQSYLEIIFRYLLRQTVRQFWLTWQMATIDLIAADL